MKYFEFCLHIIALFLSSFGSAYLCAIIEESYRNNILSAFTFGMVIIFIIAYFVIFIDIPYSAAKK